MIDEARIIEIKEDILSDNNTAAEVHRCQLAQQGTLFVDVMSSPGAGKTTLLLSLIERMRDEANIGNLVCPAEFDTGAHKRIMLLSVPEGFDKVYKYPPMFAVVDALVVTKTDYLPLNPDFDMKALAERARVLNPRLKIFEVCARTGDGVDALVTWLEDAHAALGQAHDSVEEASHA